MVAALYTLPNELLSAIFAGLDRQTLLSAAGVSRNFSQLANLALYRRVYYVGTGEDGEPESHLGCGFGDDEHIEVMSMPSGTRIFNFHRFYDSLQDSEFLRKNIREASFCWSDQPGAPVDQMIQTAVDWLCPTARVIHLSPPPDVGRPFIEYAISSLQIDCEQLSTVPLPEGDLDLPVEVRQDNLGHRPSALARRLHMVCSTPTLKRLWLEDFAGESFPPAHIPAWQRSSPVTYLCLQIAKWNIASTVRWVGSHLRELLSWPEHLRVFHLLGSSVLGFSYHRAYGGFYLIEALWWQRQTLEALVLEDPYWFPIYDAAAHGWNLREFSHLRVLSIPAESIARSKALSGPDAMDATLAYLPPRLETLQLQFTDEEHALWFGQAERVRAWLRRLVALEASSLPCLKQVILWQDVEYLDILGGTRARFDTVLDAMRKAGVHFATPETHISPIRDIVHIEGIEWLC